MLTSIVVVPRERFTSLPVSLRSLFATMIPKHKSSEFFGFFGVFEKFAGIIGPLLFAATVRMTGTSRTAILSVIAFFVVGAILLWKVDVAEGQRAARA